MTDTEQQTQTEVIKGLLTNLEKLDAAATKAPWKILVAVEEDADVWTDWDGPGSGKVFDVRGWGRLTGHGAGGLKMPPAFARAEQKANSALVAVMRNALPVLLAEIRRLSAVIEKNKKIFDLKTRLLDRLPFCPDHRDKVSGKPCRECEIEHLYKTFAHVHVAKSTAGDDACLICGLDIRNDVHSNRYRPDHPSTVQWSFLREADRLRGNGATT